MRTDLETINEEGLNQERCRERNKLFQGDEEYRIFRKQALRKRPELAPRRKFMQRDDIIKEHSRLVAD